MTASSEAPGPPLSSGRLPGDRGRVSYPIHPHSFPSLSLCQDQEEGLGTVTPRHHKAGETSLCSLELLTSASSLEFLIIFLAPISGAEFNIQGN